MVLSSTPPRRGFNFALILAVIGVILGGFALFLGLMYDPSNPGSLRMPFSKSLDRYDMKTAAGTAKAEMEMQINRDFRAMLEYETQFREKQLKERFESFKVDHEADFKREPDKNAKASRGKSSGDFKILFVIYKEDGAEKKEVIVMEKFTEPDLWKRNHTVTPADVEKKDAKIAADMNGWK